MKVMLALASLLLLAAVRADGQPPAFTFTRIAEGVYTTVQHDPLKGVADGNATAIINDEDVVIVDASLTPASARAVLAELRKLTSKPVRYVIATHWHDDHVLGARVYLDAFPAAEFVAHPFTRDSIEHQVIPSLKRNLETQYPAALKSLQTQFAGGLRKDGKPLTREDSANLRSMMTLYSYVITEWTGLVPILPTLIVDRELTLHRGRRTIAIKFLGRGNTGGDLVVHLPNDRVVLTGDLLVHPIPFGFGSFISEWPATLRAVRALDAAVIVPGHGAPQRDWKYLDLMVETIESVWTQVRAAVASGKDLEATRKAVDIASLRARIVGTEPAMVNGFIGNFEAPVVERAYREAVALRDAGKLSGGSASR